MRSKTLLGLSCIFALKATHRSLGIRQVTIGWISRRFWPCLQGFSSPILSRFILVSHLISCLEHHFQIKSKVLEVFSKLRSNKSATCLMWIKWLLVSKTMVQESRNTARIGAPPLYYKTFHYACSSAWYGWKVMLPGLVLYWMSHKTAYLLRMQQCGDIFNYRNWFIYFDSQIFFL